MGVSKLLDEGKRHFGDGQFALAAESFRAATESAPQSLEPWLGLGFALHAAGEYRQALCAFEEALAIKPDQPELQFGHGLALMESGDAYRAIRALKRCLELEPEHATCRDMLKKALVIHTKELFEQKNYVWAEQMIQDQLDLDEHDPDALAQMVELKTQLAEYDEAKRLFRNLAEHKPDYPGLVDLADKLGLRKQRERGWLY